MKKRLPKLSRKMTLIILGVVAIGILLTLYTKAATPFISAEPETGAITGSAVSAADTAASGGRAVTFRAASTTTTFSVNDTAVGTGLNQFNYSTGWLTDTATAPNTYQANNHYTNVTNATYQVQFSGTQIKVYSEKNVPAGIAAYSIDGGAETLVDSYSATRLDQVLLYTSPVLTNATHTLKVRVTGTKNAAATGTYIAADRVDITGTTTPPVTTSPSGQPMPTTAPAGWKRTFSEDFTVNAPLGTFPSAAAYNTKWAGYDGFNDTSKNGTYSNAKTLSVANGMLDMFIHSEGTTRYVAGPVVNNWATQTYGRYTVRFKSDPIPQYKTAWLLWPGSDIWNEGEIDFPEGNLNSTIGAFSHCANVGNPGANCGAFSTTARYTSWHTTTIEWTAGKVVFILDGTVIGTVTSNISNTPMRWVLQTETQLGSVAPDLANAGHVSVDWVTVDSPL